MKKKSIFAAMIAEHPELNDLSARKFSQLKRIEMYRVAKIFRANYSHKVADKLYKYNSQSNGDLAQNLFESGKIIFL